MKWKTKLETTGNGSPIVWANRLFITTGAANANFTPYAAAGLGLLSGDADIEGQG